ncbi:Endo-1,4-beta-xylanase B [Planctomycetes bacterium MalM25]|nr:Endo-1,4-beta-xylanase B [Planctomycetes bacterium MalM25]
MLSKRRFMLSLGMLLTPLAASAEEVLLSDFNNSGFSYTYGGFQAAPGASSTRLYDPLDGWGAGVRSASLDLSTIDDGRLVIDFTPNTGHETDSFLIHLNDADGLSGRWAFNTSELPIGQTAQLTSLNTIANPNSVYDGSGFVDTPPDLSRITSWAIEGQWGSSSPFDLSLDNLLISNTVDAPPPYVGYELDAPWRAEAATRIDQLRKADLAVEVRTASGLALPGAGVSIGMVRHEFEFGSAMSGNRLVSNSPADIAYRDKAAELFTGGTFYNDLKWPPWEGNWGSNFSQAISLGALDWAEANDLAMRGHVMVWPARSHLPNSMKAKLDEYNNPSTSSSRKTQLEDEMRQAVLNHIADIGSATEGKLADWDVINEIRDNHDLMDLFGDEVMVDWFNAARAANPSASLYLNEFNILAASGSTDSDAHQSHYDSVAYLLDNDAAIDGLGLQSHFSDARLTGPEKVWQILDRFAEFDLEAKVTEYTYSTDDEELQERFTRDFATAVFAHESIDAFITWGSSVLEAAADPSQEISPVDVALMDLFFNEWWTDESTTTDAIGLAAERVFRGLHDITVELRGQAWTTQQMVSAEGLDWAFVLPDAAAGDFNGDGAVDAADYTVWRDTLSEVVTPWSGADADGDGVIGPNDLAVWRANYGATAPANTSARVPEPSGLALVTAFALLTRRPRRTSWRDHAYSARLLSTPTQHAGSARRHGRLASAPSPQTAQLAAFTPPDLLGRTGSGMPLRPPLACEPH